ncbi:hypothetical protein ACJ41O_005929 [Fusarium nematophilum]
MDTSTDNVGIHEAAGNVAPLENSPAGPSAEDNGESTAPDTAPDTEGTPFSNADIMAILGLKAKVADRDLIGSKCEIMTFYNHSSDPCDRFPKWSEFEDLVAEERRIRELGKAFAVIHRRSKVEREFGETWMTHSIEAQSPRLQKLLDAVFQDYPSWYPDATPYAVGPPFKPYVHRWSSIQELGEGLDEKTADEVQLLRGALEPLISSHLADLSRARSKGTISFESLWLILSPGCLMVSCEKGYTCLSKLVTVEFMQGQKPGDSCWILKSLRVNWNGSHCGLERQVAIIQEFVDSIQVTKLATYPLEFAPDRKHIEAKLLARGRKFEALRGFHVKACQGTKYTREYNPVQHRYDEAEKPISGRIIVDAYAHYKVQEQVSPALIPLERFRQDPSLLSSEIRNAMSDDKDDDSSSDRSRPSSYYSGSDEEDFVRRRRAARRNPHGPRVIEVERPRRNPPGHERQRRTPQPRPMPPASPAAPPHGMPSVYPYPPPMPAGNPYSVSVPNRDPFSVSPPTPGPYHVQTPRLTPHDPDDIDIRIAPRNRREVPGERTHRMRSRRRRSKKREEKNKNVGRNEDLSPLTDLECLLAVPRVKGLDLSTKEWSEFNVDEIDEVEWNESPYNNLVLPEGEKDLIMAFTDRDPADADRFDDFMAHKGEGIIILLCGPPGVGKTLTAEAVAEKSRVPLYIMSAGDLGTDAAKVEHHLLQALECCQLWNAVLLIDEADVFLETRDSNGLDRNELVSIFLRRLEYYRGLMFLTTNRFSAIDPAFKSRLDLILPYSDLDEASRRKVWVNFVQKLGPGVASISDEDFDELAKTEMNGREIKNSIKMALVLAKRDKPLRLKHLTTVVNIHTRVETLV